MARALPIPQILEPPSCSNRFLVGRDQAGGWSVRDEKGLVGGLFVSRDAAIHFAASESNHVEGAVVLLSEAAPTQRPGRL